MGHGSLEDKILVCVQCNDEFVFTKEEQVRFGLLKMKWKKENPHAPTFKNPKRCPVCRRLNKLKQAKIVKIQEKTNKAFSTFEKMYGVITQFCKDRIWCREYVRVLVVGGE